jgi:hypothetical protein
MRTDAGVFVDVDHKTAGCVPAVLLRGAKVQAYGLPKDGSEFPNVLRRKLEIGSVPSDFFVGDNYYQSIHMD